MEIKGSNTYAANASMQLAATEKNTELAKQPAAQSSAAVDSVTISKEAQALLDSDAQAQVSSSGTPAPAPKTMNSTGGEPEIPPGWPPTVED